MTAWMNNRRRGNREVVGAVEQHLRDPDLRAALRLRPEAGTVGDRIGESAGVHRELLRHRHGRPADDPSGRCRGPRRDPRVRELV